MLPCGRRSFPFANDMNETRVFIFHFPETQSHEGSAAQSLFYFWCRFAFASVTKNKHAVVGVFFRQRHE
jgi:hypothetical protein